MTTTEMQNELGLKIVPIDEIKRPKEGNLRKVHRGTEEYKNLVESIREDGLLNPISVSPNPAAFGEDAGQDEPTYILVDGGHRLGAYEDLTEAGVEGFSEIKVNVVECNEGDRLRFQIIGNANRLNTKSREFRKAMFEIIASDPDMSQTKLARILHVTPAWVSSQLKLNNLSEEASDLLEAEKLDMTTAIAIARLPEDEQDSFAKKAAKAKNKDKVRKAIKDRLDAVNKNRKAGRDTDEWVMPDPRPRPAKELRAFFAAAQEDPESCPLDMETLKWVMQLDAESIEKSKAAHLESMEGKRVTGWKKHLRKVLKMKNVKPEKGVDLDGLFNQLEEADADAASAARKQFKAGDIAQ